MSFPYFSPYTFGCMSLGKDLERVSEDVAVARRAMESGVWFHCSPTYNRGFSFMILRMAFDQDRTRVPRVIAKVRDGSPELMRFETEDICRRLGVDGIDVAQLVSMDRGPGNLVSQLRKGGPLADELASLRDRGLIRRAVVFVDRENSEAAVRAVAESPLVEGLTCYWNAYQRDVTRKAWEEIRRRDLPVLALRTLAGADQNNEKVAAWMEEAGCTDGVEFAVRLAAGEPTVRTTIGGTRNLDHLERFLTCAEHPDPLPETVYGALDDLLWS